MSMQEFPDDELDELFRKSAEEFEPDFEPQAWAAMRKKLDTNDGIQKRPALLPLLLLLLLLISGFSVGGYLLWPRLKTLGTNKSADTSTVAPQSSGASAPNQPKAASQNTIALSPDNPSADPSQNTLDRQTEGTQVETEKSKTVSPAHISEYTENVSENIPSSTSDKSTSTTHKKAKTADSGQPGSSESLPRPSTAVTKSERSQVTSDQKVRDRNPVLSTVPSAALLKKRSISNSGSKTGQLSPVDDRKTNDNASGSSGKKSNLITDRQNRPSSTDRSSAVLSALEKSTAPNSTVLTDNNGGETVMTESRISTPNELLLHPWKFLSVAYAPIDVSYTAPPPPLAIVKKPQTATSPVFKKGLSVRILAAPDLSFIGLDQMKRPGTTLGALLEYRFSKRFSLQAGAIRAMKLYDALGSQYVWPEAWYSQKARPVSIEAACKVLDIPINLRYDITQSTDRRWFVSTGISSYRMLNEKYIYNYAPHTYGIKWRGWEGSTGDYRFSVLNLSMGFERQLGKRFTLQAEPYFKVPLAQVGLGQIKLNTAGIYLSTRYRLGRF